MREGNNTTSTTTAAAAATAAAAIQTSFNKACLNLFSKNSQSAPTGC